MKKLIPAFICIFVIASCQIRQKDQAEEKPSIQIESMAQIFPTPKAQIKTVGIYLYDGYSSLNALGPYSVFIRLMGTHVFFIARHKGIIPDGSGLKVEVDNVPNVTEKFL